MHAFCGNHPFSHLTTQESTQLIEIEFRTVGYGREMKRYAKFGQDQAVGNSDLRR
jgi:hypothetical protein